MQEMVTFDQVKERLLQLPVGGRGKYVCSSLVIRNEDGMFHTMYHDHDISDAARVLAEGWNSVILAGQTIEIPCDKRGRIMVEAPRIMYHSTRPESRGPHGLTAYPIREAEAADSFPAEKRDNGRFIWLSPTPLSYNAIPIDLAKLDPQNLRYTGQAEGYMLHCGDIPREAFLCPEGYRSGWAGHGSK